MGPLGSITIERRRFHKGVRFFRFALIGPREKRFQFLLEKICNDPSFVARQRKETKQCSGLNPMEP
jgi:hypothetical protein